MLTCIYAQPTKSTVLDASARDWNRHFPIFHDSPSIVIRNVSCEADIWSIFIYVRIEQLAFSVSTPRIVLVVNKYTIF